MSIKRHILSALEHTSLPAWQGGRGRIPRGPEESVALAPAKEFEAGFGPSATFVTAAFKSLWGHFAPDA